MDFLFLRLNSCGLTSSICALAAIILQLVTIECRKVHMVDWSIANEYPDLKSVPFQNGALSFQ